MGDRARDEHMTGTGTRRDTPLLEQDGGERRRQGHNDIAPQRHTEEPAEGHPRPDLPGAEKPSEHRADQ